MKTILNEKELATVRGGDVNPGDWMPTTKTSDCTIPGGNVDPGDWKPTGK